MIAIGTNDNLIQPLAAKLDVTTSLKLDHENSTSQFEFKWSYSQLLPLTPNLGSKSPL